MAGLVGGRARAGEPPPAPPAPLAAARAAAPAVAADLLFGEFPLAERPVVDGDTIRLARPWTTPAASVRVHALDTEEVFHGDAQALAASRADFAEYAKARRGALRFPVKYPTQAGEEAKRFAERFFAGVAKVRLERDEAGRDLDGFGRVLAHVFATKDGKDVLYAEEAIRAGMSPYFVKYGRSRRFDARLAAAQAEARAGKRGIWGEGLPHYPDYDERLAWWEARAAQVDAWDRETLALAGKPEAETRVRLGVPAETARLDAALLGKRVTLFGSLRSEEEDRTPRILQFVDAPPRSPFPVVVFDEVVWKALDHLAIASRFVRVSGRLSEYRGRPQIVLESAADLSTR